MVGKPKKVKKAKKKTLTKLEREALNYEEAEDFIAFIKDKLGHGQYIYRGVPKEHRWRRRVDISSNIFRQHRKNTKFDDKYRPVDIEKGIIEDAAKSHFPDSATNREILTDIRHFGGLTTLIDFSYDLMVALFFACHGESNEDGQLIVLATDKITRSKHPYFSDHFGKNDRLPKQTEKSQIADHFGKNYQTLRLTEKLSKLTEKLQIADHSDKNSDIPKDRSLVEPAKTPTSSARVIAQKSVFVHAPDGFIPPKICTIFPIYKDLKVKILTHLKRFHHIDQRTIYNDLHGFIDIVNRFAEARLAMHEAEKHMDNERYGDAIKKYTKAINLNPDSAEAYVGRGIAKSQLSKAGEASADFDKAIRIDPDYTDAYFYRGLVEGTLGDLVKSIASLTKVIELDPKHPDAYYVLGLTYQSLSDDKNAQANFDKAKELGYEMPDEGDDSPPQTPPNPQKDPKSK